MTFRPRLDTLETRTALSTVGDPISFQPIQLPVPPQQGLVMPLDAPPLPIGDYLFLPPQTAAPPESTWPPGGVVIFVPFYFAPESPY